MGKSHVGIYCDGSSIGNPGPSASASLLVFGEARKMVVEKYPSITSQYAELLAAKRGLEALKGPCKVTIYSDSQYLIKGMNKWVRNWAKNGWKTFSGKDVLYQGIWMDLTDFEKAHDITWVWIRGHRDHPEQNEVDELARTTAREYKAELDAVKATSESKENGQLDFPDFEEALAVPF
jgi:ribonuclease HI